MKIARIAVVLFLYCTARTHATSFFYINANGVLYIAGDTKIVYVKANSDHSQAALLNSPHETVCKMIVSNQYVVALKDFMGHDTWEKSRTGQWVRTKDTIVLKDSAKQILSHPGTPDEKILELKKASTLAANEYFEYNVRVFHQELTPGITYVYLFYLQNGIGVIKAFTTISEIHNHRLNVTNSDGKPATIRLIDAGGFGEVGVLYEIPIYTLDFLGQPVQALNTLLDKQSDITGSTVGPPFTIFQLSSSGGKWVQSEDTCKDFSDL